MNVDKPNKEDAIEALIQLGLTIGEAKAYVALAEIGVSEATPLATKAEVPQPKIYSYLEKLENRNLITKTKFSGKANKYSAIDYDQVIDQLKSDLINQVNKAKSFFDSMSLPQKKEDNQYIIIYQGENHIKNGLADLRSKIDNNVSIIYHDHFQDFVNEMKNMANIELIEPFRDVMTMPKSFQNLVKSPLFQTFKDRKPMLIFSDLDWQKKTCKAVNFVAHPLEGEHVDPVMVRFTHPVIVKFQAGLIFSILEMLN